jgi:hypothetical protein
MKNTRLVTAGPQQAKETKNWPIKKPEQATKQGN